MFRGADRSSSSSGALLAFVFRASSKAESSRKVFATVASVRALLSRSASSSPAALSRFSIS